MTQLNLKYDSLSDNFIGGQEFEDLYVKKFYSNNSKRFNDTRVHMWPYIKTFFESCKSDEILIDVGCGNGKNLKGSPCINYGCDNCPEFVDICVKNNHNVILSDILDIKFESNFANIVLCIAVIHHISSLERRILAVQECFRLLQIGGRMLFSVWKKNEQNSDNLVSWNKGDDKRFIHFFEIEELNTLFLTALGDKCKIDHIVEDKDNLFLLCHKIY